MIGSEVQLAFQRLQEALGASVVCGQIVLNVNNGELASVERIREFERVPSAKTPAPAPPGAYAPRMRQGRRGGDSGWT